MTIHEMMQEFGIESHKELVSNIQLAYAQGKTPIIRHLMQDVDYEDRRRLAFDVCKHTASPDYHFDMHNYILNKTGVDCMNELYMVKRLN